jgi:serine/threonine protein kinase
MLEKLAHYKILDRIGSGGIGEVYRGRDTRLGRTVAIKMVRPEIANDLEQRRAFLRDARAAASLSHPNIASLDEIGDEDGRLYLVFEFVSGDTLKSVVAGRPMNPKRAVDYAIQIADALADIHASGIVHEDLTLDNIIVTSKGATKLLDVGLAAWTAGGALRAQAVQSAESLDAGAASRTAVYMSPEQALGGSFDHRTDIFSLGIVLVEMLTGRPAFASASPEGIPLQIMQAAVPAPSAFDHAIPRELDPIVAKMLAKSLDGRYASAASVASELRTVASMLDVRSETAEMQDSMPRAQSQRQSAIGWLVALFVLAGIGVLVWMATQAQ